jgi:DNA polymerase-2
VRREAEALRERVQARIGARIRDEYGVEPRLELELEKVYEHFFLPRVRGGRSGSKKRYAGWLEGRLDVVGLEAVRSDWPAVAGRLQRGLLERLFTGGDTVAYAREVVREVREGEVDAELVYAKRVRKGSPDHYTTGTPPHVQAARKAGKRGGPVIRYVLTRTGPEPVLPGEPIPAAIDRVHYVERVLRPVAEAILAPQGRGFDEVLGDPRQLELL